jgi:hypothetical protein
MEACPSGSRPLHAEAPRSTSRIPGQYPREDVMDRVISLNRGVTGLFVLLLVAAIFAAPAPVNAVERPHIAVDPGGGGGGIVIPTEGDPIDGNEFGPTDPIVDDPADDPIYRGDLGARNYVVGGSLLGPSITFADGWFVYLVFDHSRGVPVPALRFGGLVKVRGE